MFGNKLSYLKNTIRSFTVNYSRQQHLDRLAAQKALEARIEDSDKSGNSDKVAISKPELAPLA